MNKYMKEAVKQASLGIRNGHGGPFGCVIVKDGSIIGRGHNMVVINNDPTCHGEIMAIRDACAALQSFSLKGCELYTTAQPCPMCLGAILWAGIEKVYYGCNIGDTEKIGFKDSDFYKALNGGGGTELAELDRDDCLEVFAEYAARTDNIKY